MGSWQIGASILFCFIGVTYGAWTVDKPFDDAGTAGVSFSESSKLRTNIAMDENLPDNSIIAKMNFDDEGGLLPTPQITSFADGKDNSELGARAEKRGDDWFLVVELPQDFETPSQKDYGFYFNTGAGGLGHLVILVTRNLKDNVPVITQVESFCKIDENTVVTVAESGCTFTVFDPDGFVRETTFDIPTPADSKFKIAFIQQIDAKQATAALVVDAPGLDYEISNLHILTIVAGSDAEETSFNTSCVVQVGDLPDMPPVWTSPITPQTIVEQQPSTLHVKAADGDVGTSATIGYKLDFSESPSDSQYFSIDETGEIAVTEIDRDMLTNNDVFRFTVTAFEVDDPASKVSATMVVIVTDINDNFPEISSAVTEVAIEEGSAQPLNFDIEVNDPDLAEFGQFSIELQDESGNNFNDHFFVIPSAGYQTAQVTIGVRDAQKLDYEDPLMRSMVLKLVATEQKDDTRWRSKDITINLIDVNDEPPVFEELEYRATVFENIAKGTTVATVRATDADFGDEVTHSLSLQQTALAIDAVTGKITVAIDNAFDYERQTSVIVQVTATDKGGHTTYIQLVIQVEDVNDTPPTLVMPSTQPSVEENKPNGPLEASISATDVDLDAVLTFTIDWPNSYATKQGARVDEELYVDGLKITTSPADPEGRAGATGSLSVIKDFLDYEAFDILALSIVVEDEKTLTEYSDARTRSAILSIKIIDLNDNKPQFTVDTMSATRTVTENSNTDQLIGAVTATDADGPGFNDVTYTIIKNDDRLPDFLVMIDANKGELRVNVSDIDCDDVYGDKLKYIVIASDGDPANDNELEITIDIIDQNDETPESTIAPKSYEVTENAPSKFLIATLTSKDNDFSVPFHTVSYFIDARDDPSLNDLFELDSKTGELTVKGIDGGGVNLDRDQPGFPTYKIPIILRDNYQQGSNSPVTLTSGDDITIVLSDENDNAPTFPPVGDTGCDPGCLACPLESVVANAEIVVIEALDIDEGINAIVTYQLLSISKLPGGSTTATPENLFKIDTTDSKGKITVTANLLNLWGDYNIELYAEDQGVKPMNSTATYKICVKDVNDNKPVIVYPVDSQSIRLQKEQTTHAPLLDINGFVLKLFSATDADAGSNGAVTFTIVGDAFAQGYFTVINGADNTGELQLLLPLQPDTPPFVLQVEASDAGIPEPLTSTATVNVVVLTKENVAPEFTDPRTWDVSFIENDVTLNDILTHEAEDENNQFLKPEDPEWDEIFYYLIDDNSPGVKFFDLDKRTRELTLIKALDREQYPTYQLFVLASNVDPRPNNVGADPDSPSQLILNVKVEDVNDNPPKFDLELFPGGVSTGDKNGKVVLTVTAVDPDENDSITYTILKDTIEADPTLEAIKDNAFLMDPSKGELALNFDVGPTMSGFLKFDVKAIDGFGEDTENHTAISSVKVFVIADSNRVTFKFLNDFEEVNSQKIEIMAIFTEVIGYDSAIDEVVRSTDSSGTIIERETSVTTHFIDTINNLPVENTVITGIVNNRDKIVALNAAFYGLSPSLVLADYDSGEGGTLQSSEALLRIILIAVSVILGLLVIILFAAFVIKTRSLNRRLEALSTTKFGSVDSGLNRVGMNVPGANKRAVEGSNPVWNEDIGALDNISQGSYDSDLIGIEENPEFNTPSTQQGHVNGAFDGGAGDAAVGRRVSVNPLQDAARRPSINPLSNGGTMQRNALSHQVSIDSQASDDDSVMQQANSNFSFGKKDESIPVTEL